MSAELMRQLLRCTAMIFDTCADAELTRFADAHLWVAYVGAMEEVRRARRVPASQALETWFREMLRTQCKRLNVWTWPQMRAIAERFLYASFLEPDGSLWFVEILGENPRLTVLYDHSTR